MVSDSLLFIDDVLSASRLVIDGFKVNNVMFGSVNADISLAAFLLPAEETT